MEAVDNSEVMEYRLRSGNMRYTLAAHRTMDMKVWQ